MTIEEFLRIYPLRAANLMWFLGAGASASGGVPTANSLVWDFKRTLFCAAQKISPKTCDNLSNPLVQRRLDSYFQDLGIFPASGSPEEYASYFEATYADPSDRRTKLEAFISGARPSFGHIALAALMKMQKARVVWTVNFDRLIEDAAVQILGTTSSFVVSTLDNPQIALRAINEARWPVIGKMHGDFQSHRLKNTSQELRLQDAELRRGLLESLRRFGLIVVGYSGRDDSIMSTLHEAINNGQGYPGGLFWVARADSPTLPAVTTLLSKAIEHGIQAYLLEIETFDELLGDILKQLTDIPADLQAVLDGRAARLTDIPVEQPGQNWPIIRMNALPLTNWPTTCRRIVCAIGGTKQVREAVTNQHARAIAARAAAGVIAFGSDGELKKAFNPFHIEEFDCHAIEPRRLRFESAELGLLRDAFALAVEASGPFQVKRSRSSDLLIADFSRLSDGDVAVLTQYAGSLTGTISETTLKWREALRLKLDYHLGRLWLLLEPTIYIDELSNKEERYVAADFVRERLAARYNRQWNSVLEAWIAIIIGNRDEHQLSAFAISDGIDASFTVAKVTGFSRKGTHA
jgi:NAD-dependent SIR2 family protein deacetylase